jgi:hypothetical protein
LIDQPKTKWPQQNGVKLNWPSKFAQNGPKFAQNMGDKEVFLNML